MTLDHARHDLHTRTHEHLALTWDDVHLDTPHPTLIVRSGKGRKSRRVPLSDRLRDALSAYRPLPRRTSHQDAYLLPYRTWAGAARHLRPLFDRDDGGSDRRGFHAFRNSMGTRLYDQLEDFVAVAEILGHVKIDTTRAYVRVGQGRARKALRGW
ncbi:tyrosine-type recombinase/integrase [Deinococcus pimensis]|uniref:tyrosine-type recombinase/integrase n=1 Tax=Deinococcus pimensis TaxID=309888 RepID=UPI0004B26512|nr:tyrosine-type recombinase/integrase [Deinococcus pimensis]